MLPLRKSGGSLHVLQAAISKIEWRFLWATWSPSVQPMHGVLLGGWFLGKIWWAPFKVQNVWMISMRNPCLAKKKVFSVLTGARISWTTIFFRNDHSVNCSSWKHNLIWLLLCPSRCSRASRNFSGVAAFFPFLLNGALPVFESSTLFSSQNQPTSSPNLLSLQVQNHPLSNPSFSFLFIFNNINLIFPLLHSAVISSFYMQPRFLFEAMISLPLMRTLPKTFTPTFQCIHPTMHPRKSSNYSISMWLCTPSILFLQNFKVNRLNKKNHNNNDKNE